MTESLELLGHAERIVRTAGATLSKLQGGSLKTQRKELLDVVTEADLAAEEILVEGLRRLTPHAGVLAEERGWSAGTRGQRWIIDPLDGTVNYASGLPWFSVTVAYEVEGVVELGLTHAPCVPLDARFVRNRLATVDSTVARVRSTATLADAVVSVCLTSHFSEQHMRETSAVVAGLARTTRGVRIVVSGGFEMALVASGRLDAFVNLKGDVVSHATGAELIRAAGGRVTTLDGSDAGIDDGVKIASNAAIHEELLAVIHAALAQV